MKLLYLAHRIPYPPNKGDKIRTFNEIKYLSATNTIDLLALVDDQEDLKYRQNLNRYCRNISMVPLNINTAKIKSIVGLFGRFPLSVIYFYTKRLQTLLDERLSKNTYDAVICFSSPMAEYLFRSKVLDQAAHKPVLIMDYCDLDSQKWDQYAKKSRFPVSKVYQIESRRLLLYEKYVNRRFDHSVFISPNELNLFRKLYPSVRNLTAIPNGVDSEYFSPSADFGTINLRDHNNQKIIVFTGAMDYYANIDGVIWFCQKVFPIIKKKYPDTLFYIVGNHPTAKVRDLEQIQGVRVTGFVEDIRPYYQESDVCVVPLRIAAGIQNKVLEAMAMAKPVVTTSNAFKGINGKTDIHAIVEDKSEIFAQTVIRLLENRSLKDTIQSNARKFILKNYNWQENIDRLNSLCSSSSS